MAYHVESLLVCDCCHGNKIAMPGHNGRDVLEREAQRRGWTLIELPDTSRENYCRACSEKLVKI